MSTWDMLEAGVWSIYVRMRAGVSIKDIRRQLGIGGSAMSQAYYVLREAGLMNPSRNWR